MDVSEVASDKAKIRFIRDVAEPNDFFGTHAPVAEAIAEVIRTNEDIKVIGLLGPWGSGKSTVVKILKEQLNSQEKAFARVFTYDAWLHQSDPPRRSFLEALLHFLVEEKLTEEDDWSEKLDVLNRRVEDTVTTTTPRLTFPGTIMVLSLLLIPLGAKYANLEWYKAAFNNPVVGGAKWIFYLGLACFMAPALIAGIFYMAWRPTRKVFSQKFWTRANLTRHRKPHQDESILSFFMNRETKTNYNKIIKEPEPTAMEFQDAFREAMEIVAKSQSQLIIVVDNLDRLPETEAIAMWSTIRSFFLGGDKGFRSRKSRHEPVVILPIAEDAIQRIYGESAPGLAKSFMEKTFDLTFFVNRPVLTKWTDYLRHQMEHVFRSEMDISWPFITSRFYERYSATSGLSTITPRGINTLVNSIATRWLQWKGAIAFETIAYYCTFREAIERNIIAACASPLAPIGEYDPDWQNSIAAMYYGVQPQEASEVLLDQPLKKAILDGDASAFGSMATIPSVHLVLHRVIEGFNSEPHFDPKVLFNAATLMGEVDHTGTLPEATRQTWLLLRSAMARLSPLVAFPGNGASALLNLLKSAPAAKRASFLDLALTVLQDVTEEGSNAVDFAELYVHFLEGAASVIGGPDKLPNQILVPGDSATFSDVASRCEGSPAISKRLRTAVTSLEITKFVSDIVNKPLPPSVGDGIVMALANSGQTIDWSKDIERISTVIRAPLTNTASLSTALLVLGLHTAQVGNKSSTITGLSADLVNRLNEAYSQKQDLVIARSIVLLVYIGTPFTIPDANGWTNLLSDNSTLFDEIDRCLTLFSGNRLSPLTLLVSAQKVSPDLRDFASNVAVRRVGARNIGPRINVKDAIEHLAAYQELLPTDELKSSFIVQLSSYETFWDVLHSSPLDGNAARLYGALLSSEETTEKAGDDLQHRLQEEPSDTWETAIISGSKILGLATQLKQARSDSFEIGQAFSVLDKTAPQMIDNGGVHIIRRWFSAVDLVGNDDRITLFKNLRDRVNSGIPSDILGELIFVGGEPLLVGGAFSERPDDSVRHVVLPLLADPENAVRLRSVKAIVGGWISNCADSTRKVVIKQLKSLSSSSSPVLTELGADLQESWGLAIDATEETDADESEASES